MNAFFAILKIRGKALFQYRAAAFAGVCTQLFWGFVSVMIFKAFYRESSHLEPLSLSETITFVWLGQSLVSIIPWHSDKEIEAQIRTGQVAYELARPLDLYGVYFARSFAMRIVPLLMRFFPIFFIAWFFLELKSPVSWTSCMGFILSVLFASLLSASITAFASVSLFWTLSGDGIKRFLPHCVSLLSGTLVPLPLFPLWMQGFLNWQPFRGIIDIPCRIYTGVIPANQILYYFGFQLAWTAIFIFFGRYFLDKALKRTIIQGG